MKRDHIAIPFWGSEYDTPFGSRSRAQFCARKATPDLGSESEPRFRFRKRTQIRDSESESRFRVTWPSFQDSYFDSASGLLLARGDADPTAGWGECLHVGS